MAWLRKKEVAYLIGRSVSGLDKLIVADPSFPRPIKASPNRQSHAYFDEADIKAWEESQKAQRAISKGV